MTAPAIITLDHIDSYYGHFHALKSISLSIQQGDTTVLLGPSGAGKSTLLRVFNLLAIPSSGTMNVLDQTFDFSKKVTSEQIKMLRQKVGIVFQNYNLWPHLTVLQNLIEAPIQVLKIPKAEAIEHAHEILKRLAIDDFSDRYPLHLSGGQQQRVAIARALMMQPQILLFDEPTAALDPQITTQVANIIHELASTQITQVIVTHDVHFAKKVASHVVYLEQGAIIEQGDLSQFEAPETSEFKAYLSH